MFAALALSCGSKDKNESVADATATTTAETPAAPEAEDTKTIIAKAWMLDNIDVREAAETVPEGSKAEFSKSIADLLAQTKGESTFDFAADGKVTAYYRNYENKWKDESGTWTLSDDNKKLTITLTGGPQEFQVVECTENKLSLNLEGMVSTYIPKK